MQTQTTKPGCDRPAQPIQDTKPEVLIAGAGLAVRRLINHFEDIGFNVKFFPSLNDIQYVYSDLTVASVLVPSDSENSIRDILRKMHHHPLSNGVPTFVIGNETWSNNKIRGLYQCGVNDVLTDIAKTNRLPRLILNHMTKKPYDTSGATQSDRRLANAIAARLATFTKLREKISIYVRNGVAYLMGKTRTQDKKKMVVKLVNSTPGVHRVEARRLQYNLSTHGGA